MKHLANILTVLRIAGAVALLFTTAFSPPFWALYLFCGLSDVVDGLVARGMQQQSDLGAKLDSIADVVFIFAAILVVVPAIAIPLWAWVCAGVITLIRVVTYLIGFRKYRAFPSLHTWANKVTGGLLFCMPILLSILGMTVAGIILGLSALFSACEELVITVRAKELDRDRKGLFVR